jgi:hypothetical protein
MPKESVDSLIERVMSQYPDCTPSAQAKFFEAVHQELAPLARELESENQQLREQFQAEWNSAKAHLAMRSATRQRAVYTCGRCGNVYRAGDMPVTIYAENGAAKCRACNPSTGKGGQAMTMEIVPR